MSTNIVMKNSMPSSAARASSILADVSPWSSPLPDRTLASPPPCFTAGIRSTVRKPDGTDRREYATCVASSVCSSSIADLEPQLGPLLTAMLVQMTDRGPDSAGVAVYAAMGSRMTAASTHAAPRSGRRLGRARGCGGADGDRLHGRSAVLVGPAGLRGDFEARGVAGRLAGATVEVFKGVGPARRHQQRLRRPARHGYQGVGHTRMATESAVTTDGSHPFSTHDDLCVVHNGSFSNYFTVKRDLEADGERFLTANDTEVAARLIGREMSHGRDLGDALQVLQKQLDGFYTLVCATRDQIGGRSRRFGVQAGDGRGARSVCGVASEFRALAILPDIEHAEVFEPTPTELYCRSGRDEPAVTSGVDDARLRRADDPPDQPGAAGAPARIRQSRILNPRGRHNIAVGSDAPPRHQHRGRRRPLRRWPVRRTPHTDRRLRRLGRRREPDEWSVRVTGNASERVGASAHGGTIVVEGDASTRAAISLKGGAIARRRRCRRLQCVHGPGRHVAGRW